MERLFQGSQQIGFKKGNRNSAGTAFWSMSRFLWFWYDFAMVWLFVDDFNTILIQFWYDFDMVLIQFEYGSDELASNHDFDPHQESKLKPYQDHIWNRINIIAAEQLITTNHIWNVWKTLNKKLSKNLHPRDFGCYNDSELFLQISWLILWLMRGI